MRRDRLLSALRRWCRKNGRSFRLDTVGGKGSHIKIYVGNASTIIKDGELSPVYVQIILKQLDLPKDAV